MPSTPSERVRRCSLSEGDETRSLVATASEAEAVAQEECPVVELATETELSS